MDIDRELEEIKKELIQSCAICGGTGYGETGDPCECMKEFRVWNRMYPHGFGRDYLRLQYEEVIDKIVFEKQEDRNIVDWYVKNMDKVFRNGLSLYIWGRAYGVGKSTLSVLLVKQFARWALFSPKYIHEFEGHYMDVVEILKWDEMKDIDTATILVIDEFGKRVLSKEQEAIKIEKYLRNRVKSEKAVIIVGNISPQDIAAQYSESLAEFIGVNGDTVESNVFRSVHVVGESFRTMKIESKWR